MILTEFCEILNYNVFEVCTRERKNRAKLTRGLAGSLSIAGERPFGRLVRGLIGHREKVPCLMLRPSYDFALRE